MRFSQRKPDQHLYFPIVYFNDFWVFQSDCVPINTSSTTVPLFLHFKPLSFFRWQIMNQVRDVCGANQAGGLICVCVRSWTCLLACTSSGALARPRSLRA